MPGTPEILFIFVIVLLMFGPKKLPELARGIGQSLAEFKKARDEFEREVQKSALQVEIKEAPDKALHHPEKPAGVPETSSVASANSMEAPAVQPSPIRA